jgi:hypothetical protein
MADENTMTETEDGGGEDEIIIIEEPESDAPSEGGTAPAEEPAAGDDEDDDDERLGSNEQDTEEQLTPAQIKRRERRERERRARENQERELNELRAFKQTTEQRIAAVESNALGMNAATLEMRLAQAQHRAAQAEEIRKRAEDAGSISDVMEATRIRDAAIAEVQQLEPVLNNLQQVRYQQTVQAQQPQPNPAALELARAWQEANPWYSDTGSDPNSLACRQIAAQLTQQGYNGGTLAYWQEMTRRLNDVVDFGSAATTKQPAKTAGRKSPPMGQRGESVTPGGKRQFYLSPERKQAMIDGGIWEDPVARQRQIKAYADYDRNSSAGQ